ncbi:DNA polymerase (family 10) [Filimonas lacunae]|uniref:DNA polymerase (Family 10) n=1 Tax=Filimonas lacunae TaxID=477680 RepID=A0A173MB03_9BACT|nr:DNA polymerase/3'-5' exonuclease PolX [Filimonas lacunae]BAV04707.1 DNA polymerase X family protein [Filimonas lacunae]SIT32329.1 DNA polymerase (family 10) [Filimonas lacunae]
MTNAQIADNFTFLAKIMEIHGENSFKTKSYSSAAFTIDKLPAELSTLPEDKIFAIKGIGEAIGKKIQVQLQTGQLPQLNEYIAQTPPGIIEMMQIKGIGPKKIATIWKDLEIETLGELLYACNENRLLLYKGFGAKTQQNIKESIEFYIGNQGSYLYAQVQAFAKQFTQQLQEAFPGQQIAITGDYRRQIEVISKLEWVTTIDAATLDAHLQGLQLNRTSNDGNNGFPGISFTEYKGPENIALQFYTATPENFYNTLFTTSSSEAFFQAFQQQHGPVNNAASEEAIFEAAGLTFIPPCLREKATILTAAASNTLPALITKEDITAIIHSHSNWSDGSNSIEEMANAAMGLGLQYLVLSDHSKSAFYANGLNEDRLIAQHKEIDALNKKLAPFTIFKSIESDILNDGNLDYSNEVLSTFDVIIASVHSNLKMPEDKAMARLLKAIENPYTNILGHMTGRLLLSRNGYPLDHKKIIEACAANNVVIELNAHPRRLDIDWRWIDYALEKNVLISINPDAHAVDGYHDVAYGVLAAQKAGVTKQQNLSSFSLEAFQQFLATQHGKRK